MGGSSQNWTSFRLITMHFRAFFKSKVQNWDIFGVAKISNIFLGCLIFLIFFWGERWTLGPSLRMRKNKSTPWDASLCIYCKHIPYPDFMMV